MSTYWVEKLIFFEQFIERIINWARDASLGQYDKN